MKKWALAAVLAGCSFGALAQGKAETTIEDQMDVAVTAYNNGLALVRDTRKLSVPTGEVLLTFSDVAQLIKPETVSLRSTSTPGSVQILEQNYEYDLMSPEKLLEKFVGREVKLVNQHKDLGFESVTARLLSMNSGAIYEVNGEIYLGHPGNVVLPEIPENLIAEPSLVWTIENDSDAQTLEATYLTNGMSWRADYVLTLAKDDSQLDIDGWVTMDNQTGATYENARLKLVAGDVNVVSTGREYEAVAYAAKSQMADAMMPMEESFAEFHLYTIARRTTIKQNQSKQVMLLTADSVNSKKKYEYRGETSWYFQQMPPMLDQHVGVFIEFENEEANALGIPLPAGIMRLYQEDSEGMLQFAGEDRIQHTPKDETVTLRMGDAFDVIGERVQTDFQIIGSDVYETAFEIKVRNHKEEDVVVDIVEPMPSDWNIISETQPHVKKDAFTAIWSVPVPVDGEAVVSYRVRVRY